MMKKTIEIGYQVFVSDRGEEIGVENAGDLMTN